jgi:hypothetical protein
LQKIPCAHPGNNTTRRQSASADAEPLLVANWDPLMLDIWPDFARENQVHDVKKP